MKYLTLNTILTVFLSINVFSCAEVEVSSLEPEPGCAKRSSAKSMSFTQELKGEIDLNYELN